MPTQVLHVPREALESLMLCGDGEKCKIERIIEISSVDEIKIVIDDDLPDGVPYIEGYVAFVIVGPISDIDVAIKLINYEVCNFQSANKVGNGDSDRKSPISQDGHRVSDSAGQPDVDQMMRDCNIGENWLRTGQNSEADLHIKTEVVQVPRDIIGRVLGEKLMNLGATKEEFFLKRAYAVTQEELAENGVENGVKVVNGFVPVVLVGEEDNVKRAKNQLKQDVWDNTPKMKEFYSKAYNTIFKVEEKNIDLMLGPNGKTLQKARDILNTLPFIGRIKRESESSQLYTYEIRCNDKNAIEEVKKLLTEFRRDEIEITKDRAAELLDKIIARNMVARVTSEPPGEGPNVRITLEGEHDDVKAAKSFIYEELQNVRKFEDTKVAKTVFVNRQMKPNSENERANDKSDQANKTFEVDEKTTSNDVFNKELGKVIRKYAFEAFLNQPLTFTDYFCKDNMKVEVVLTDGIYCEALVVDLISDAVIVSLEGSNCDTQLVIPFNKVRFVRGSSDPMTKFCVSNKVHAKLNFQSEYANCDLWCTGIVKKQSQKDSTNLPDLCFVEFIAGPLAGLTKQMPFNKMRRIKGSVPLRKNYFTRADVPVDKLDTEVIAQIPRPDMHKLYLDSLGAEMFVYDALSSKIVLISKGTFDLQRVAKLSLSYFDWLRSLATSNQKGGNKRNVPAKHGSNISQSLAARKRVNEAASSRPRTDRKNLNSSRGQNSTIASDSDSKRLTTSEEERVYSEEFNFFRNAVPSAIRIKDKNITKAENIPGIFEIYVYPNSPSVEIVGENVECVKEARTMLEYQKESFTLQPSIVDFFIGGNSENVRCIEKASGVRMCVTPITETGTAPTQISLFGPVRSVCHAKILIENLIPPLVMSYTSVKDVMEQSVLDLEAEACDIGYVKVVDVSDDGKLGVKRINGETFSVPFSQLKFLKYSKFKGPITKHTFYKVDIPIEEEFGAAAASYDHGNFEVATCASSCVYHEEAHVLRLISRTVRTKELAEKLKDAHISNVKKAESFPIQEMFYNNVENIYYVYKIVKVDPNISPRILNLSMKVAGVIDVISVCRDEYEIRGDCSETVDIAGDILNYVEIRVTTLEGVLYSFIPDARRGDDFADALHLEIEKYFDSNVAPSVTIEFTLDCNRDTSIYSVFAITAHILGPEELARRAKEFLDANLIEYGKYFIYMDKSDAFCMYRNECLTRFDERANVTCVEVSSGGIIIRGLNIANCWTACRILDVQSETILLPQRVIDKLTFSVVEKIKSDTGIFSMDMATSTEPFSGKVPVKIVGSASDREAAAAAIRELEKIEESYGCLIQ